MTNTARKMRYIPGLDGVRAIAVAAVVLYHIHVPFMQGGLLGVTMFFVISGYIITRSLIHEVGTTKTIDFKGFYLRRVRRLLPAICLLIPVTVVLCALLNRVMLTKMRPDILPSLLFVNNWWQIFNQVSYFNALGDPSPLTHFWSLAIEEQFYLIWPLALFLMYRAGVKRPMVRRIVAALAVVSALAMTVLYNPGGDPSRIYYGTDTRAFSLLAGVWLALLPMRRFELARGRDGMVVEALGVVGLVGLLLMFALSNGYTAFQYRGGMVLCTVFTMMLVAASAHRGGAVARGARAAAVRVVGKAFLRRVPLALSVAAAYESHERDRTEALVADGVAAGARAAGCRGIVSLSGGAMPPWRAGASGPAARGIGARRCV